MKNIRLSRQEVEVILDCIRACEQCIEACQAISDVSSGLGISSYEEESHYENCISECHAVIESVSEVQEALQDKIAHARAQTETLPLKDIIEKCDSVVKQASKTLNALEHETKEVLACTESLIKVCDECAEACEQVLPEEDTDDED